MESFRGERPADPRGSPPGGRSGQVAGEDAGPVGASGGFEGPIRNRSAIKFALAQQFVALVATAFLLDCGTMLHVSLFAIAAHWAGILMVILRRPSAPTWFDLGLIRFGFIPVGVASVFIAGLLGRGF